MAAGMEAITLRGVNDGDGEWSTGFEKNPFFTRRSSQTDGLMLSDSQHCWKGLILAINKDLEWPSLVSFGPEEPSMQTSLQVLRAEMMSVACSACAEGRFLTHQRYTTLICRMAREEDTCKKRQRRI